MIGNGAEDPPRQMGQGEPRGPSPEGRPGPRQQRRQGGGGHGCGGRQPLQKGGIGEDPRCMGAEVRSRLSGCEAIPTRQTKQRGGSARSRIASESCLLTRMASPKRWARGIPSIPPWMTTGSFARLPGSTRDRASSQLDRRGGDGATWPPSPQTMGIEAVGNLAVRSETAPSQGAVTPRESRDRSTETIGGGVAQLVEQRNHNPWVRGSSPCAATFFLRSFPHRDGDPFIGC